MYELHTSDPAKYTAAKLAANYGVRVQRVIAILTLKKVREPRRATRCFAAGR